MALDSQPPQDDAVPEQPLPEAPRGSQGAPRAPRSRRRPARVEITPEDLHAAMADQEKEQKGWIHSILVLVFSLMAFTTLGLLQRSITDVAILILVLFIHESGHYLGMRIFNYRNVKMFFIPFLGAAVSGQKTQVEGWKQAVVCLMGPLPGVFIGVCLYGANVAHPNPTLEHFASIFLILNAFQLIPIYPLDGGRFLNEVLFVRSRHLETGFRVIAGVVAIGAAVMLGSWLIGAIGFFVLTSASDAWRIGLLVEDLRSLGMEPLDEHETEMPIEVAYVMMPMLTRVFPNTTDTKVLAMHARNAWERLCARPPGWLAALALMGVYLGTFVALCVALAVLSLTLTFGWDKMMLDGGRAYKDHDFVAAETHYRRAALAAETFPPNDLRRADTYASLGLTLYELKKFPEAEEWLRKELTVREKVQGKDHADLARVLFDLSVIVAKDPKRKTEADALEARANKIENATPSAHGPPDAERPYSP